MDFYKIKERSVKNGVIEIYPDFKVCRSKDLMVRGKAFYAIWDEEKGLWSTDEFDVQRLVDNDLLAHAEKTQSKTDGPIRVLTLEDYSTKSWSEFRNYVSHISDNAVQLDTELTFSNDKVTKKNYASKKLQYPLGEGSHEAFDKLISTLYNEEEKEKLEWAIGSIISGDSKSIQKFIVLYGAAGAGKSTILNIIQKLFEGYYTTFEAKALTSSSNAFATEAFKSNPLVAIQHDGDLSKIEDNTKLNSIVSHEDMRVNEKYKPSYTSKTNTFLFMGTNNPVKITNAKSGIIRRLIDVTPSGRRLPPKEYQALMCRIDFELGAIAKYCLDVYLKLGKNYYSEYKPYGMMFQTDVFFNFVESSYDVFKERDGVSLMQAYQMYKEYCDDSQLNSMAKYKFREELRNYFEDFKSVARVDGVQIRNYYSGFKFKTQCNTNKKIKESASIISLDSEKSLLDEMYPFAKAQYANEDGTPINKWSKVTTTLSDIDTTKLHYVKLPKNHIVIDFDIKVDDKKSLEANMEAASKLPPTYTEISKSGNGIHLHYSYLNDVEKLEKLYAENVEIKTFKGGSALRRKLTKCNNVKVTTLNSGLPLKGDEMINFEAIKNERAIRTLIKNALSKKVHPNTKSNIDFIKKVLDDAYKQDLIYDVTDLRPAIFAFAAKSTNQAHYCLGLISEMKFVGESLEQKVNDGDAPIAFFDVEVFPNLFMVCWKKKNCPPVTMINPSPSEIEDLVQMRLVGFNCRRYDNHMLYARMIGYSVEQLYTLSQRIISGSQNAMFMEAYNISYTDIYEFSAEKKSLKKFEIELGIHHKELNFPWDEPVPEEHWENVAQYCSNDVVATEAVFNHRIQDYNARLLLAKLSGLSVNAKTQTHAAKIIFEGDKNARDKFVYTDLSKEFPGYKYEYGKSTYRGIEPGEGGYIFSNIGTYRDVYLLDISSMHPTSLVELNAFGIYTKNFKSIVDARLAVKHGDHEAASKMLNGLLAPYLGQDDDTLAYALKIIINLIYGMTSAKYDNEFKDPKNVDNIVAKRGALFMIDLQKELEARGCTIVHIKTDSVKLANPSKDDLEFVYDFGKKYGYTFEQEAIYKTIHLINNTEYAAQKEDGTWVTVGAQLSHPYVYKSLFSNDEIELDDLAETKSVTTAMYLAFDDNEDNYVFVGKVGSFVPVKHGGGVLYRKKEDGYNSVGGTKGYLWKETEQLKKELEFSGAATSGDQMKYKLEDIIDFSYHESLVDKARRLIDECDLPF